LIAFFSESKAVVIYVNKFGEQFIDLFALFIIWIITLVGLIVLFLMIKEEKSSRYIFYKTGKRQIKEKNQSFLDIDNNIRDKVRNRKIKGTFVEPLKNIDEKINLKD
jgi:hypothetical protein